MKIKKRSKRTRARGSKTQGWGARKRHKGSGSRGGVGMAGTGKRAGQKLTFVKKYLLPYFGKQGLTSRKAGKDKHDLINLKDINIGKLTKMRMIKKTGEGNELNLGKYKLLGEGEIKEKLIVKGRVSKTAKEKIERAGGKVL